jgi:hypothetical protein
VKVNTRPSAQTDSIRYQYRSSLDISIRTTLAGASCAFVRFRAHYVPFSIGTRGASTVVAVNGSGL